MRGLCMVSGVFDAFLLSELFLYQAGEEDSVLQLFLMS